MLLQVSPEFIKEAESADPQQSLPGQTINTAHLVSDTCTLPGDYLEFNTSHKTGRRAGNPIEKVRERLLWTTST